MMRVREWFAVAWCRVVYGHVMVKLGNTHGKTIYQCARCTLTQLLQSLD
jgi:predicted Abi (CAAX) family protease